MLFVGGVPYIYIQTLMQQCVVNSKNGTAPYHFTITITITVCSERMESAEELVDTIFRQLYTSLRYLEVSSMKCPCR